MPLESVKVEVMVPKEGKEVIDAASAVIEHFKLGKPLAEAALLLPAVMAAVDGYNKVGDEIASEGNDELAGYAVQKIFAALKAKPVA